jgi:hypothetical protein
VTQCDQIVDHLNKYGSISPLEARHVHGIERLASRVDELRKSGFKITTTIKKDAKGKRYAEYAFTKFAVQASQAFVS